MPQLVKTKFGEFPLLGYVRSYLPKARLCKIRPKSFYGVVVDWEGQQVLTPQYIKNINELKSIKEDGINS